ncbi:MAG: TonB-dependent receptor [Roseateles sp.]|uniref:TonB-dependent receptor n=1 Tax=Roseateles sp. TaxID=1971397 RepID=UPI0040354ECD
MKFKPTPIAVGLASLLLSLHGAAVAQQAAAAPDAPASAPVRNTAQQLQIVTVTGLRAAAELALTLKRDASANVDVITAVDVGKMPDKNLADSLQRVVGVAVRTDYDEAEKVSMRGTNPDMSLILFNGHTVSGGDWFIADQMSSSRSTSLSLMPSSVLNSATVYKTSQANIVDGGLAGTINVTTRKPLEQKAGFGGVVSAGAVHADLPGKTSPQLNASINWKNEANNFGLIAQVFAEKRYVRRDSISSNGYGVFGWDIVNTATMLGVTDATLAGSGYTAAALNGVRMPGSIATEFVEGVRDRKGGMLALQFRPTAQLDLGVTGFMSKMNAANYGRLRSNALNSMLRGLAGPQGGATPLTSSNGQRVYAQIKNPVIVEQTTLYGHKLKVLQGADIVFAPGTTPQYIGDTEHANRAGASASSGFLDFDFKYQASENLKLRGLLSTTRGEGTTEADRVISFTRYGTGVSYKYNGLGEAPDFRIHGAGANVPVRNADGSGHSIFTANGANRHHTVDRETSLALDAEYTQDSGIFSSLEFGARHADHRRDYRRRIKANKTLAVPAFDPALAVAYPGDFGNGFGGSGNWDRSGFYFPTAVIDDYYATKRSKETTPEWERFISPEIELQEKQSAAYLMQNLEGDKWSGNIGVRIVKTTVNAMVATPIPAGICARTEPGKPEVPCAAYPTAITTAGNALSYFDGAVWNPNGQTWYKQPTHRVFDNILPSLNLRVELARNLIGRIGLSQTLGRQNYNLYGASFSGRTCNAGLCTVNGPNPTLKPMTARNVDASVAWFFDRRAMVSASIFDSQIDGYAKTGVFREGATIDLFDPSIEMMRTYQIQTTSQQKARIQGFELAYEQPIGAGFGFTSNVSLAETKVADGRPMIGASRKAANLGVYFENNLFSARLVYNYRGEYVASTTAPAPTGASQGTVVYGGVTMPVAPTMAAAVSNVAFSANYNFTPALQFSFNATNLTNPTRAQYRYSELEQQKIDSSGRQYYLEGRYKF